MIFGEAVEKVYSPECRQEITEKLYREQGIGNKPDDANSFALQVELSLNRQLLYEVLARVLCKE